MQHIKVYYSKSKNKLFHKMLFSTKKYNKCLQSFRLLIYFGEIWHSSQLRKSVMEITEIPFSKLQQRIGTSIVPQIIKQLHSSIKHPHQIKQKNTPKSPHKIRCVLAFFPNPQTIKRKAINHPQNIRIRTINHRGGPEFPIYKRKP